VCIEATKDLRMNVNEGALTNSNGERLESSALTSLSSGSSAVGGHDHSADHRGFVVYCEKQHAGDHRQPQQQPQQSTSLALEHFHDALQLIGDGEKACYVQARETCPPAVFQYECDPLMFLRACQWDPWQAAQRMVAYWNERLQVFGPDRAFLPMILPASGTGDQQGPDGSNGQTPPLPLVSALSKQDIEILETGAVMILPPDREGRSVVFIDRTRLLPEHHHQTLSRLRALWYVFHRALLPNVNCNYRKNRSSDSTSADEEQHQQLEQQQKIVCLALLIRPPNAGYDFRFPPMALRLPNCLPVTISNLHLLTLPAASGTGRILQAVVSMAYNVLGSYFGQRAILHHGTSSPGDLLRELKKFGLGKRGLPSCAGGSFDGFDQWLNRVRRKEQVMYATEEQLQERKRLINKVHSVKKRQRRKREWEELNQQVCELNRKNATARKEQHRLEQLLLHVREMLERGYGSNNTFIPDPVPDGAGTLEGIIAGMDNRESYEEEPEDHPLAVETFHDSFDTTASDVFPAPAILHLPGTFQCDAASADRDHNEDFTVLGSTGPATAVDAFEPIPIQEALLRTQQQCSLRDCSGVSAHMNRSTYISTSPSSYAPSPGHMMGNHLEPSGPTIHHIFRDPAADNLFELRSVTRQQRQNPESSHASLDQLPENPGIRYETRSWKESAEVPTFPALSYAKTSTSKTPVTLPLDGFELQEKHLPTLTAHSSAFDGHDIFFDRECKVTDAASFEAFSGVFESQVETSETS